MIIEIKNDCWTARKLYKKEDGWMSWEPGKLIKVKSRFSNVEIVADYFKIAIEDETHYIEKFKATVLIVDEVSEQKSEQIYLNRLLKELTNNYGRLQSAS